MTVTSNDGNEKNVNRESNSDKNCKQEAKCRKTDETK